MSFCSPCRAISFLALLLASLACGSAALGPESQAGAVPSAASAASSIAVATELAPANTDASPAAAATASGAAFVGRSAPGWGELEWLNTDSSPLAWSSLRGRVVLVRFWTDRCPHCAATAPALAKLHEDFAAKGLTVIGMFHPKPHGTHRTREQIAARADELGLRFPLAIDDDWSVLDSWWPPDADRRATSVSFVVDTEGVVRFVHPGPEFHPDGPTDHDDCRRDYAEIRAAIESLLPAVGEGRVTP